MATWQSGPTSTRSFTSVTTTTSTGAIRTTSSRCVALEPAHETVTLDDYRTRLAQYRRDPDLQELHRQTPFIVVWDDHETANNSWMGGAENHTPPDPGCEQPCDPEGEGDWSDRVAAARRAFFEWIPIRDNPGQKLYRTLPYGDLADIIMIDTRIEGREEQLGELGFPPDDPNLPDQILGPEQEAWLSRATREEPRQMEGDRKPGSHEPVEARPGHLRQR